MVYKLLLLVLVDIVRLLVVILGRVKLRVLVLLGLARVLSTFLLMVLRLIVPLELALRLILKWHKFFPLVLKSRSVPLYIKFLCIHTHFTLWNKLLCFHVHRWCLFPHILLLRLLLLRSFFLIFFPSFLLRLLLITLLFLLSFLLSVLYNSLHEGSHRFLGLLLWLRHICLSFRFFQRLYRWQNLAFYRKIFEKFLKLRSLLEEFKVLGLTKNLLLFKDPQILVLVDSPGDMQRVNPAIFIINFEVAIF